LALRAGAPVRTKGGFMKKLFLFAALFLGVSAAHAGLLIEPYLGTTVASDATFDTVSPPDFNSKQTSSVLGARLGVKYLGFWVAANHSIISGKMDPDDATLATQDFVGNYTSVDVGYDFPIKLRVFAGYGFNNALLLKGDSTTPSQLYSGTSMTRIGFSYTIAFFFSLNFEIIKPTYNKYTVSGVESDIDTVFNKINHEMTNVTISFPFSL
jgi:hypothetical protein